MNTYSFILLCPLLIFVGTLSCATNQKAMENFFATGVQKRDLKKFQMVITHNFYDPSSAKFRNLKWAYPVGKSGKKIVVLCGEVNAKNQMGGYTGYSRFYSNGETGEVMQGLASLSMIDRHFHELQERRYQCACSNGHIGTGCYD